MQIRKRLILTPGEPAGVGPDIVIQLAQQAWPAELMVIADPNLLQERAKKLALPLTLHPYQPDKEPVPHQPGSLVNLPVFLKENVIPGQLNSHNAAYVIETLTKAIELCKKQIAHAVITGPVQKSSINQAGIAFSGHTEFFSHACGNAPTVMLFVVDKLKVALLTTHIPLKDVSAHITQASLKTTIDVLQTGLQQQFGIQEPRLFITGVNPHAGEQGYLGREEIDIIQPVLNELRKKGHTLVGPLSADTLFTPHYLEKADVILAMYHDQALPVVKYAGFGQAVNVTLGLPFIRTSVDHGTALDVAGTGAADASSLEAAVRLALTLKPPVLSIF